MPTLSNRFDKLARWTAHHAGRASMSRWRSLPLWYGGQWSDVPVVGHLAAVINTGTTIVTFLMVFLIQNTQNRDTEALQLKLDELIHRKARNRLLQLEELTEEEMEHLKTSFTRFAKTSPPLTEERKETQ